MRKPKGLFIIKMRLSRPILAQGSGVCQKRPKFVALAVTLCVFLTSKRDSLREADFPADPLTTRASKPNPCSSINHRFEVSEDDVPDEQMQQWQKFLGLKRVLLNIIDEDT